MKLIFILSAILLSFNFEVHGGKFEVQYQWKSLLFSKLDSRANFNNTHPVPFGIAKHGNRMFIGMARRASGVPVTLGYYNLDANLQDPPIIAYPSMEANTVNPQGVPDAGKLVSVYRPRVDECDRLWFVDTGVLEFTPRIVVQKPSIWVMNLKDDKLINRYEIPTEIFDARREEGRGIVALTIDNADGDCKNMFAYLTDWMNGRMTVYSLSQNKAWVIDHNFFHFDPTYGNFNVGGFKFTRRDRLFSIALSHRLNDGYRIAFFHSMVSDAEFVVSTQVLRNESLASRSYTGTDFKLLGRRGGTRNQAGIHVFDPQTRVMFTTMLQRNAVDCWRFDLAFSKNLMDEVDQDEETLYYPVDIILDEASTLWILANKMPKVIYGRLDFNENNFYVLKANPRDLIRGTKCNLRDGVREDDCNKIFDHDRRHQGGYQGQHHGPHWN